MVELTFEYRHFNSRFHICSLYRVLNCPDPPAGKKVLFIQVLGVLLTNSSQSSGFHSNCAWLKRDTLPNVIIPSRGSLRPTSGSCRDMKAQLPSPQSGPALKGFPSFRTLWGQIRPCCCHATVHPLSQSASCTSSTGADPEKPPPKLPAHKSTFQNLFLGEPSLQHYSYPSLK